jgi:hypothetical protein
VREQETKENRKRGRGKEGVSEIYRLRDERGETSKDSDGAKEGGREGEREGWKGENSEKR